MAHEEQSYKHQKVVRSKGWITRFTKHLFENGTTNFAEVRRLAHNYIIYWNEFDDEEYPKENRSKPPIVVLYGII